MPRSNIQTQKTDQNSCNALGQSCDKYPARPSSGPAHLSSLSMHPSPHNLTLQSLWSPSTPWNAQDPSTPRRRCTPPCPLPEVNAHILLLPSRAHTCLVTCRPKLKYYRGSRLEQSSSSPFIFSAAPATVYNPTFLWLFNLHFSLSHQTTRGSMTLLGGHCSFC